MKCTNTNNVDNQFTELADLRAVEQSVCVHLCFVVCCVHPKGGKRPRARAAHQDSCPDDAAETQKTQRLTCGGGKGSGSGDGRGKELIQTFYV